MDLYIIFDPLTNSTLSSFGTFDEAKAYQLVTWYSTLSKYKSMPVQSFWNYFRLVIKHNDNIVDDGKDLQVPESSPVIAIYKYGSRIYGTLHKDSDYDYNIVMDNPPIPDWVHNMININYYSPRQFQEAIENHEIWAIECISTGPILAPGPQYDWHLVLDLSKLRVSISKGSDNAFHKGKQKLVKPFDHQDGELMRGKKSLFHAFRILKYGIQIVRNNKVVDFGEANDIFNEIMKINSDKWSDYEYLKKRYNTLASEFRQLAPKN